MNENVYKKGDRAEYLEVKSRLGVEKIELKKVLYFMSDVRVVEAHMQRGETFRFYEKLDVVQEQLDSDEWLRCHKSYLVNRKWIRQITRESLTIGKETIPVSRNYYMQLRDKGLIGRDKDKMEMTSAPDRKDMLVWFVVSAENMQGWNITYIPMKSWCLAEDMTGQILYLMSRRSAEYIAGFNIIRQQITTTSVISQRMESTLGKRK